MDIQNWWTLFIFTLRKNMVSLLCHTRKITSEVTSLSYMLYIIWVPIFQYISEQRKKKTQIESIFFFFSPRSQHKTEMWRNRHYRKRFFCSRCIIMRAWALERSVSCWATPFPVLFSAAWQLICWLPIHFSLPSDFFHSLFCSSPILSACIFGSGWCRFSWQFIVINHVHESSLLCCEISVRTYSRILVFLEFFTIWASVDSQ